MGVQRSCTEYPWSKQEAYLIAEKCGYAEPDTHRTSALQNIQVSPAALYQREHMFSRSKTYVGLTWVV